MAEQDEEPPPHRRRESRPTSSFMISLIIFDLCVISVMSLLLYMHSSDDSGDPEPGADSPSCPAQKSRPALEAVDISSYVLHRFEGVKVGYEQKVKLVPNKIHVMKTLSLKPPIFEIPDFLSEDECKLLIHLAERKGLNASETIFTRVNAHYQDMLDMDQMDIFKQQDRNKDGKLQIVEMLSFGHLTNGFWLTPEDIQEIYAALKADPDGNGVLSLDEFKEVNLHDFYKYVEKKKTNMSSLERNSQQAWLSQGKGDHPILRSIQQRVIHLTRLSAEIVERSEDLQVVRYDQGGYSLAHQDTSFLSPHVGCIHTAIYSPVGPLRSSCRYATVLFYLNNVTGGGETTFPFADNSTYDYMAVVQDNIDLRDTRRHCDKGNLRIKPRQGTAVFWYNFLPDGKGWVDNNIDPRSWHGGCVVTEGTKWIANRWINVDPVRWRQFQNIPRINIADQGQCEPTMDKSYSDVCVKSS